MPQVQEPVLVQDEGETVIGACRGCRHAESAEGGWLTCDIRGRVNITFARQFHDCYEPRTCVAEDYDD